MLSATHTLHLGYITDQNGETIDQVVAATYRAPHSFTGEDTIEFSCHGSRWIQNAIILRLTQAGARPATGGEFSQRAFINGKLDLAQAEGIADLIASSSKAAQRIAINQLKGTFSSRLNSLRDKMIELASLLELELDFSEEDVEFADRNKLLNLAREIYSEVSRLHSSYSSGQAIKNGIPVAIIGPTNAGKSSLLNTLIGDDRAIVSQIHGTTRDTIEETCEIGDYLFRFIDTAGLRSTTDPIEQLGIERSRKAISQASIILIVVDATTIESLSTASDPEQIIRRTLSTDDLSLLNHNPQAATILLLNKQDLLQPQPTQEAADQPTQEASMQSAQATIGRTQGDREDRHCIAISTQTGHNIENLKQLLQEVAAPCNTDQEIIVTNARHAQSLAACGEALKRVIDNLHTLPLDLIAQDLRESIHHLSLITGSITTTDLLTTIFSRFCIGK
jgi:tRNA modification GTPase